jgi:hypothetical protein
MAIARQGLSSNHVVTPTDMNATNALQKKNSVFYMFHAKML